MSIENARMHGRHAKAWKLIDENHDEPDVPPEERDPVATRIMVELLALFWLGFAWVVL